MSEPRAGLATCPEHQLLLDVPCGRCGDYECTRCITTLEGTGYCRRCVADGRARDYLDDYRDRLWGKRDGWAWLIGLGAIANIFVILATIGTRT